MIYLDRLDRGEPTSGTDPLAINLRLSGKVDAFLRDSGLEAAAYRFWGDEPPPRGGEIVYGLLLGEIRFFRGGML